MSARPTKGDLRVILERHIGRANGIDAQSLALQLGCNGRMLRYLVTGLRRDGVAVCGHPSTGYFVAENEEELEETCRFLRSRAMQSLELESKLRKSSLADLLGQLRLPT